MYLSSDKIKNNLNEIELLNYIVKNVKDLKVINTMYKEFNCYKGYLNNNKSYTYIYDIKKGLFITIIE